MNNYVEFVGPNHALRMFGITMVGLDAVNGHKAVITVVYLLLVFLIAAGVRWIVRSLPKRWNPVPSFWMRQAINMAVAILVLVGLLSIWFDNPTRLATGIGLASAGLAFALQKFVTSIAGYYTILSTNNFTVGDRITMGGVRGDVIALNFIQTTIMEMGQPPSVSAGSDPGMWVASRQFTGRIVSVSNSMIFDSPVYNYTRDFQFIWEEIHLPITYTADREHAEEVMLEVAKNNTLKIEDLAQPELNQLYEKFSINAQDLTPKVFYRLTDNWIELTVRFIVRDHGIRDIKDRMFRQMLAGFDKYKIGIASSTYDIVGLPPITVQMKGEDKQA
jgi:small-conductance mechanosensitive channel